MTYGLTEIEVADMNSIALHTAVTPTRRELTASRAAHDCA